MRKVLGPGLLLCALIAGCETKSPTGPSGNTPTTSTTTSIPPTTTSPTTSTSSSTTSTIVLRTLSRRYSTFSPPPNVPADMTLLFELISAPAALTQAVSGDHRAVTENEYKVTGVYVMGNGTTGTITGELGEAVDPLETGGQFEGSMTATMPSGCTALRDFAGTITPTTLTWTGGQVGTTSNPCSPNPLTAFNGISMLRNDPSAPLPTTTSSIATTSTSTTTIVCTYSISPTSANVSSSGGSGSVSVNTQTGCEWAAASFAPYITITSPYSNTGPGTVTYTVAPTSTSRTGTMLIAGNQFVVNQSAPSVDLVPYSPTAPDYCRLDQSGNLVVGVNNLGTGSAGSSTTQVVFVTRSGGVTTNVTRTATTPPVAPGVPVDVQFTIPSGCFTSNCSFGITVNSTGSVTESPQPTASSNNTAPGLCLG